MKNWLKYNKSQETYFPTSFEDVIVGKKNAIHTEAFEIAKILAIANAKDENNNPIFLKELNGNENFDDSNDALFVDEFFNVCNQSNAKYYAYLSDWKFVEINNESDDYMCAPQLMCTQRNISKSLNNSSFIRHKIDLAPWWSMSYEIANTFFANNLTNNMIDQYNENEIIEYDYIRKTAKLQNRVEMIERKIPFSHIRYLDKISIGYKNIL